MSEPTQNETHEVIAYCLERDVQDHRFSYCEGAGRCEGRICWWEWTGEFMAGWEAHRRHVRGEKRFRLTQAALTAMEALADDLVTP